MIAEQANRETNALRSLCLETTTIDPTKTPDRVFEYVDVSAVSNELWKVVSSTRHTGATAPSRARKLVQADDVIFATVRPTLKRVALVPQGLDGQVVSTAFCVLRTNPIKADPRFIYYSLLTEEFINRVSNLERGASYPAVTDNDVLGQEIYAPPLPEQRAIAAVLSKVQAAVEVQEKIVATLKELKAATMAKLFREGVVKGFMFDTNVFDKILDGQIDLSQIEIGAKLFVTHVQRDEIRDCGNQERRERLLQVFEAVPQTQVPTESFVLGTSNLGEAKLNDDSSIFEEIRKGNPKHTEDALIAETCIKQNLTLVTEEKDLPTWVRKAGGEAICFEDFMARRWRSLKQTEIGEIPESWEVLRVGDVFRVDLGKMLSPKSRRGINPRPYLRNKNVQWGRFDLSEVFEMDFTEAELERFRLKSGDILVCEGGEPGRAAVWNGEIADCCYQKALHRLRPIGQNRVLPQFYVYWAVAAFTIFQTYKPTGTKTTIAHLPKEKLEVMEVALPDPHEQKRIVEILQGLDAKLLIAEKRRETLQSVFSSMLHLLMTGQVRVTGNNFD